MAEGAGWGWSQLLREQGHLLEWPGNCEQRSPRPGRVQKALGPCCSLIQMFQQWTLRRGHRTVVWSESMHVPIGISGPAGWSPAAFRLPIHTAGEREDSSSVHSCQKGTARPPPLPVGTSCRGSQRFAPAASIFLGQESFGTKPQALEKKGTGLRSTRLRGHTGLSS